MAIMSYKIEYNDSSGFVELDGMSAKTVVENAQKELKKAGMPTGITWQLHNNIIEAMIATAKHAE